jgi:hypothetical protein
MHSQPLILARASKVLSGLLDQETSLEAAALKTMSLSTVAAALTALPEVTQQRCFQALLDGEPTDAGLVLIHAFNLVLEEQQARVRTEASSSARPATERAATHRTYIIAGA